MCSSRCAQGGPPLGSSRHGCPATRRGGGLAYVHTGSTRFAVAHESDKTVVDLWDAETLTARWRRSRGASMVRPCTSCSADGSRFLFGACATVPNQTELEDCTMAVYTLPEGRLVHRTVLPRMALGIYMWIPELSPSGTYFALSHEVLPSRAYESATGKLAFASNGPHEAYLDAQGSHSIFLDDGRLLTAAESGRKLVVTDLATGKRIAGIDVGAAHFIYEHTLSPDRKHMAILVAHEKPARTELAVWGVEGKRGDAPRGPAGGLPPAMRKVATRQEGPLEICPQQCEVVWQSAREQSMQPATTAPPGRRFRLDIETGQGTTEPSTEMPFFSAGPFRVFGGFSVTRFGGRAEGSDRTRAGRPRTAGRCEIDGWREDSSRSSARTTPRFTATAVASSWSVATQSPS